MKRYVNDVTERVMLFRDAGVVMRSHTCRAIQHRNVAEHGHGVAMLALTLAQCAGQPLPRAEVLAAALVHDLSELATGDTPAPVKRNNPKLKEELNRISTEWEQKYGLRYDLKEDEAHLLLWCDRMDFALYALEEVTMGNRHFRTYLVRIMDWLQTMALPRPYTAQARDLFNGVAAAAMEAVGDFDGDKPAWYRA